MNRERHITIPENMLPFEDESKYNSQYQEVTEEAESFLAEIFGDDLIELEIKGSIKKTNEVIPLSFWDEQTEWTNYVLNTLFVIDDATDTIINLYDWTWRNLQYALQHFTWKSLFENNIINICFSSLISNGNETESEYLRILLMLRDATEIYIGGTKKGQTLEKIQVSEKMRENLFYGLQLLNNGVYPLQDSEKSYYDRIKQLESFSTADCKKGKEPDIYYKAKGAVFKEWEYILNNIPDKYEYNGDQLNSNQTTKYNFIYELAEKLGFIEGDVISTYNKTKGELRHQRRTWIENRIKAYKKDSMTDNNS